MKARPEPSGIEPDMIELRPLEQGRGNRGGNHIAWRQISKWMHSCHDRATLGVDEHRTLTPNRLGDEGLLSGGIGAGPQHGRMELHELEITQRQPGA